MDAGQHLTYRERRERKAARLREWAEKRDTKADAARATGDQLSGMIPFGQPILVGHHSEKRHRRDLDRIDSSMRRTVEHLNKAERFRDKADNIEAAADHAIYSDDADAVVRLEERIAELEAERSRIKAYNASCRKGAKSGTPGDLSLLDEKQRAELASIARVCSYQLEANNAAPKYWLSNLSGNINRNKKRLAGLKS